MSTGHRKEFLMLMFRASTLCRNRFRLIIIISSWIDAYVISAFQFRVRPLEIKTVLGRPVGQKPSIINQNPQTLVRNNLFCVYFVTWLWFKAKIIVIWWNSTFFGGISIDTKTSQNCDHSLSYDRNDTEVISWCDDFSWPLRIRYKNAPTNRKRRNDLMLLSVVSFVCACINPGFEIRFRPAVN